MKTFMISVGLAMMAAVPSTGFAQPPAAPAAPAGAYNVETTMVGTLLDDPAAKAVLVKHIPTVVSNPQLDQGRGMTLRAIQQFEPTALSDTVLLAIQADLNKLPKK